MTGNYNIIKIFSRICDYCRPLVNATDEFKLPIATLYNNQNTIVITYYIIRSLLSFDYDFVNIVEFSFI